MMMMEGGVARVPFIRRAGLTEAPHTARISGTPRRSEHTKRQPCVCDRMHALHRHRNPPFILLDSTIMQYLTMES